MMFPSGSIVVHLRAAYAVPPVDPTESDDGLHFRSCDDRDRGDAVAELSSSVVAHGRSGLSGGRVQQSRADGESGERE